MLGEYKEESFANALAVLRMPFIFKIKPQLRDIYQKNSK